MTGPPQELQWVRDVLCEFGVNHLYHAVTVDLHAHNFSLYSNESFVFCALTSGTDKLLIF
jgi:hypothetical protein